MEDFKLFWANQRRSVYIKYKKCLGLEKLRGVMR